MSEKYFAYIDGASVGNGGKSGIGFVIYDCTMKEIFSYSGKIEDGTNNEAEYQALIECCKKIIDLKIEDIEIFSDSKLIVNQVNGEWSINYSHLYSLCGEATDLLDSIKKWDLGWIPREENKRANLLSQTATRKVAVPKIFTGKIEKIIEGKFLVYGTKTYCVDLENGGCTCPAFVNGITTPCKHIIACKIYSENNLEELVLG